MKVQNWKGKMPDVDKEEDRTFVVPSALKVSYGTKCTLKKIR
jgi:hypothetical protein